MIQISPLFQYLVLERLIVLVISWIIVLFGDKDGSWNLGHIPVLIEIKRHVLFWKHETSFSKTKTHAT